MNHDTTWKRLGDGSLLTEDPDEGLGHIVEFKTYIKVLLALVFLTLLTVYVAKFVPLGKMNIVVAIAIATLKCGLVMSWFMHVKFEGKLIISFVLYPFLIVFLLIGGTYGDYATREKVTPVVIPPGMESSDTNVATHEPHHP